MAASFSDIGGERAAERARRGTGDGLWTGKEGRKRLSGQTTGVARRIRGSAGGYSAISQRRASVRCAWQKRLNAGVVFLCSVRG